MKWKKDMMAIFLVFLILEITAAVWHLFLFRDFYAKVTSEIERPFEEYVIPYLISTNFIRALMIVVFFKVFIAVRSSLSINGILFGVLLGAISGLTAVEYYGVWEINAITWSFMEGGWAMLQGLCFGLVLERIYRQK